MLLGNESLLESPAFWAGLAVVVTAAGTVIAGIFTGVGLLLGKWWTNRREDKSFELQQALLLIAEYRKLITDERAGREADLLKLEKALREGDDFKTKYAATLAELMKYKSQGSPGGGGERYTG